MIESAHPGRLSSLRFRGVGRARFDDSIDTARIRENALRIRGNPARPPDASVVIPVNAQGDLQNALRTVGDVVRYRGDHTLEIVLVINNYPAERPPRQIDLYRRLGLRSLGIPNVRRPGEAAGFSARIPGVRAARSENVILFDADCRIPDITALADWYIARFRSGASAAYTHVAYYDFVDVPSLYLRLALHHLARWAKRSLVRVPTTRGSNYAVKRTLMLELYAKGMLADEMNVGPTFKAVYGRVDYSGSGRLAVYTSGRMFTPGVWKLARYFRRRLFYNLRVLPVRGNAAAFTGREKDPVRRYLDNRPIR